MFTYTLRGFRPEHSDKLHSQLDIQVRKIKEEKYFETLDGRLKWARSTNQCRTFEVSQRRRTTLGGYDIELACWSNPDSNKYGLCATGRQGNEQFTAFAITYSPAIQEEILQILLSMTVPPITTQ